MFTPMLNPPELFLSTPSARRATLSSNCPSYQNLISIHALREEGDERRGDSPAVEHQFLSTPSARRATGLCGISIPWQKNFYPRPPRGGRRRPRGRVGRALPFLSTPSARRATAPEHRRRTERGISIHALREEGDPTTVYPLHYCIIFLSTPSARRATCN